MDTKNQLGVAEKISCKSVEKLETKDIPHHSSPPSILANDDLSLSPITPDSNKENADLMSNFTSPLTLVVSPPTAGFYSQPEHTESGDDSDMKIDEDDDEIEIDTPSTPKEGVFDPFAPGPDKLMLAPICIKHLEESRSFVARRLNFSSVKTKKDCEKVYESAFEDDLLLEAIYESLLEAIICKQAEDMVVAAADDSKILKTPPSAPRLTGIAETCPGAPLKAVKKSRNIEMSLCRKLEFEF